mgnify:CR=1 FL=1
MVKLERPKVKKTFVRITGFRSLVNSKVHVSSEQRRRRVTDLRMKRFEGDLCLLLVDLFWERRHPDSRLVQPKGNHLIPPNRHDDIERT